MASYDIFANYYKRDTTTNFLVPRHHVSYVATPHFPRYFPIYTSVHEYRDYKFPNYYISFDCSYWTITPNYVAERSSSST